MPPAAECIDPPIEDPVSNVHAFYSTTLFWQWMRLPGDVLFAAGAVLMAWDFVVKAWESRN
ncbi:MAG TPA: hypothetical protein VGG49_10975 [Steroidobacteraceae bacterium]